MQRADLIFMLFIAPTGIYLAIINMLSILFFVSYLRCIFCGPGSLLKASCLLVFIPCAPSTCIHYSFLADPVIASTMFSLHIRVLSRLFLAQPLHISRTETQCHFLQSRVAGLRTTTIRTRDLFLQIPPLFSHTLAVPLLQNTTRLCNTWTTRR